MKRFLLFVMMTGLVGASVADRYEADWESLSRHEPAPEWMKDAKFGIYFHWGVYSVPAFGDEWYPRNMYRKDSKEFKHHAETYGDQSVFGYHDFVPMFKAEHFDPEEWADLFVDAGARFAGPVAEHHDGFAMWDSEITPWNAKNMGPKRDILGELFKSLEKRGVKTIATFHHARNLQRNAKEGYGEDKDSHYPYNPEWATASEDPKLRLLYGNIPEEEWNEEIWLGKLREVIDRYHPDIIWFDSWLDRIPETYRQRFCAYYLNAADQWGKDVAIVRKQNDLPIGFTVNDHEKAREPKALPELWMTDDTISTGSWCYTDRLGIKPLYKVVHALVDTVAKNGVVLLNLSPMADGTIPQNQRDVLHGLGEWLRENGEAIYGTRPWIVAAEGPTSEPEGGFSSRKEFLALEYSAKDIRYTASKDGKTVYAILLGVPAVGEKTLCKAFAETDARIASVSLLSEAGDVEWADMEEGLQITMPDIRKEGGLATAFKIVLDSGAK